MNSVEIDCPSVFGGKKQGFGGCPSDETQNVLISDVESSDSQVNQSGTELGYDGQNRWITVS